MIIAVASGCGRGEQASTERVAQPPPAREQLNRVVERYWDAHVALEPALSAQALADALGLERRFLAELEELPRERLDEAGKLTYDIFKWQRELRIEGFTYPQELMPIDPFQGELLKLAAAAGDSANEPIAAGAGYERWLARLDNQARWNTQSIANLREGIRRGYAAPRVLVERLLPQLARLGADGSDNVFYGPLRALPAQLDAATRAQLNRRLNEAVAQRLLPSVRALHDFLEHEYLHRAREGISLAELPLGDAWYAYRVRRATGGAQSAAEWHRTGLAEVARLRGRLEPPSGVASTPGAPAVLSVAEYQTLAAQAAAAAAMLFGAEPKAPLLIEAEPYYRQAAAPLLYRAAGVAGWPPAALYVDPHAGAAASLVPAAFFAQGIPGRHWQAAWQRAQAQLPRFRRYAEEPAFDEGWGLYAATLGTELGLYADEAGRGSELRLEMRCAAGLVVDTGIHALHWPRTQAIEFLENQALIPAEEAQLLVDGYAAAPADALACTSGAQRLLALRALAQRTLGEQFDAKAFHEEILKGGAMPLDLLEARMKLWLGASRAAR